MKQKVLFNMYIASDASYFLMDEITNGLDEMSRGKLFEQLRANKSKKTIFLTSYYSHEIESVCDEILELANGRMERRMK